MNKSIAKTLMAAGAVALASCSTQEFSDVYDAGSEDARKNEYTQKWIERFGLFDTEHDWTTLTGVTAETGGEFGPDAVTRIYNAAPDAGGHLIGYMEGAGRLTLSLPKGATSVFATVSDSQGETLVQGEFDVAQGAVAISQAQVREPQMSRAVHTPSYFDAMVVCEDLGGIGDYDFNDIVLGLRYVANTTELKITPMAAGGTLQTDVYFDTRIVGEIHDIIEPGSSAMLNTGTFNKAGKTITVTVPTTFNLATGWRSLRLKVKNEGEAQAVEITAPDHSGVAPQMFCLGGDWYWPTEKTSIDDAFTGFAAWTADASNATWADAYADSKVVKWEVTQVATNWFSGKTSDGAAYKVRINDGAQTNINSGQICYLDPPSTLAYMFAGAWKLTELNVAADHFDTSGANSLDHAFGDCSGLTKLNLSGWDIGNVTTMKWIFESCISLIDVNLSWKNLEKVTDISHMFADCTSLTNIDVTGWNMPSLTTIEKTFVSCEALETITGLETWDVSNVTQMRYLFSGCKNLRDINISNWNTGNVTDMSGLFADCQKLDADISKWDTGNVTDMVSMFSGCSFTDIDLSWMNTAKVTNLNSFFNRCTSLRTINFSGWDTGNVTNMVWMFYGCSSLESLDTSHWNTANVTAMNYMFQGCTSLRDLDISGWVIGESTDITDMFSGCTNLTVKCSSAVKARLEANRTAAGLDSSVTLVAVDETPAP